MKHIGIINYKNKIIYIDLVNDKLSCYYYHKNEKNNISVDSLSFILRNIFDKTKEEFLEYDGNYNVFVNKETGYKHFYKGNYEDFLKFFLINGKDGFLYENFDIKNKLNKVKEFVNQKTNVRVAISITAISMFLSSLTVNLINKDEIIKLDTACLESERTEYYNFYDLVNALKTPKNVGDLRTDILYNEEFVEDICKNPMTEDVKKRLEEKTTDIEIVPFTEEEILEYEDSIRQGEPGAIGYYNPLEANIIHSMDVLDVDTISHELVHLLQADSVYYYLKEACAEIISYEYYGCEITSYIEEVKRVQILMEITGSDAIWDIIFYDDEDKLYNFFVDNNIPIDKFIELFDILIAQPNNLLKEERDNLNERFDELLSYLYSSIYNEDIEDNKIIQNIYKSYDKSAKVIVENQRHYFQDVENNENRDDFCYSEYIILNEAEEKGLVSVEFKVDRKIEITEDEYLKRLEDDKEVYISYTLQEGVIEQYDLELNETYWVRDGIDKRYSKNEALVEGLLKPYYFYIKTQNIDYKNYDAKVDLNSNNIVSTSLSINPLTDKYDSMMLVDDKEIDGTIYRMVKCSNYINFHDEFSKLNESSKIR